MWISDISIKRPVLACVVSLLLVVFGLLAFARLPLREFPDIDPPIVTIRIDYPGAAAHVVESRITEIVEDRIAGIEGIESISSSSEDGRSVITVEFDIDRDIDAAANDIRDRVAGVLDNLPDEAEAAEIEKADSDEDVIIWFNLASDRMSVPELTDYADRYLVDRFSVLDGVARVQIGGGLSYAMRIWLDHTALAARELTANDVEDALRAENVELPAGSIESTQRQFTVRVERGFRSVEDFRALVLAQGRDGYLVRLGDVARVERGVVEHRVLFRGNGVPMVGIGIIKQSQANTLAVAQAAREEMARLNPTLPEGMELKQSYDASVFVQGAVNEVLKTLGMAVGLVILVIFLFLGNLRAVLVPAVAVPVSLIASFMALYALGFSINLLTLFALVLAIGLVVDDAIVVLENIHRRMGEGETALVAAFRGTRQVGFAVVATTVVLVAVFVPIAFLQGDVGRLFSEFALTMAAAVAFSGLVALTLSAMLASKILKPNRRQTAMARGAERAFLATRAGYRRALERMLRRPMIVVALFFGILAGTYGLFQQIPSEYAPREDRGVFYIQAAGPEGASFDYTATYMSEIERRLMPLVNAGEIERLLIRAPLGFGNIESFNSGIGVVVLADWDARRSGWDIMADVRGQLADLTGMRIGLIMRQAFGGSRQKPVQFVIGGATYAELAEWRDLLLEKIEGNNPGFVDIDYDYKETKPQILVAIDRDRAGDLGVTIGNIGRTFETLLGSRQVTTYVEGGEEYDVILEGETGRLRSPAAINNIYVRSDRTGRLIPLSNLVTIEEAADSPKLNRFNRVRAITLDANLADGYALGAALSFLETLVRDSLPESAVIDFKGQSQDFKESGSAVAFIFVLSLVVVFLVLAAQFESFVHPFVIMLTVPLGGAGALLALYLFGGSLNLYTQIGLIMLVGLAAKNGILIVEFANQLRNQGYAFTEAIIEAALIRLRPIVMTAITTAAGALPLIVAAGAGSETRAAIGLVVFSGVITAMAFTLFVVPVAYSLLARRTGTPGDVTRRLEKEIARGA